MTRVTFSPTTEPIEPPMNSKAKEPTETGWPAMPAHAGDEGVAQAGCVVGARRSRYFLASVKPSGSAGVSSASSSSKVSGSTTRGAGRPAGSWWPQPGQTFQFLSHSCR